MSTETETTAPADHGGHGHDEIHLPPNSWVPISLSGALTLFFVGFLIHPIVAAVGGVWTIATLVQWARAARNEYVELPEGH